MKIKERVKNALNELTRPAAELNDQVLLDWLGIRADHKAINEVTYFTCLKMLSETMGKLPLKYYKSEGDGRIRAAPSPSALLLISRPNPVMTPATFWTAVEANCQHYGNGYVWMQTEFVRKGKYGGEYRVRSFWPMQSNCTTVLMDDVGVFGNAGKLYYRYSDPKSGKTYTFQQESVMHFKTWCSFDGVMGKSVQDILKTTVDGLGESANYLNNLYKQGLTASMALQYTGDLDKSMRIKLQKEYSDLLAGAKNAGKVVPVPVGMTLQPLNIKLTDAQFYELKKYTALQIAGAFGIKPNQINDYEKSSYANSETQQLAFLVDTMLYRLTQYEQEINYKVLSDRDQAEGYFFKFNEKAILRTDAKTQMEVIRTAVNNGIYTPNEARNLLDYPAKDGGDILIVNGNYVQLENVGAAYGKAGENNGSN
ncbi:phage portal protein [Diplocloster agilis]|uniref:phage portal protein n=1 Tax=Diplocloster agilis TaxID=2850323 RepID=UPI0008217340|nr:phage portal protein [Suonthocola fibrivorans]MCU6734938.1 phage portal protein [Suonthocola fibrivorans]SCJ59395.1 phage portal protein%2C HK97 family [uncultured Clostridium sp.]